MRRPTGPARLAHDWLAAALPSVSCDSSHPHYSLESSPSFGPWAVDSSRRPDVWPRHPHSSLPLPTRDLPCSRGSSWAIRSRYVGLETSYAFETLFEVSVRPLRSPSRPLWAGLIETGAYRNVIFRASATECYHVSPQSRFYLFQSASTWLNSHFGI
eukprot:GHVT01098060.1.p1 GENE.GHVT01098060.1~~GHVT01098060.1.p1  ORF type:complete len:157 (-),score=6.52 GHVT01098060.1:298-768(-)